MTTYDLASSYVTALTGSPDSIIDWRCIHDKRKDLSAHTYRGTLRELWETLSKYNADGYGIFANVNALDGRGRELANVSHIRAHVVDLDNQLTAHASYDRAVNSYPAPSFAVQTSPGKYHIYWCVEPYVGNDFYSIHQRKFRQLYDGDRSVIDATRVLRVPGFYHNKAELHMVTCWSLTGMGQRLPATTIQEALAHVNVIDSHTARFQLGEPSLSAPSFEWLRFALSLLDPNSLDRSEWLSFTAAIKQAGWLHADDTTLHTLWEQWCDLYAGNDRGENLKLWNSIRDTEVGWASVERRTAVNAYMMFGHKTAPAPKPYRPAEPKPFQATVANTQQHPVIDSEILDAVDCAEWFKDCYFIGQSGKIFSRSGRYMNSTQFNGLYGGKHFIITSTGKTTDEAWKAALRSTVYTVPKVDHIRFLPDRENYEIINDEMGRQGINTYIRPHIDSQQGDVSIWLDWINRILPNQGDQTILFEYLAHCVKYPGYKIPWAPMIQSAEGIGKTVFLEVMGQALGNMYIYMPNAEQLVASGSKFNAWMRSKLMIMVNEIKVDERRELIEILKPMISDKRVEVQAKGADQDMEDNVSNWLFFSNYKDAIPISQNGRRYAIFYSALQTANDIIRAGMDDAYFDRLYSWLREGGGFQAVTYWLQNYPIACGAISKRAPKSSSYDEALRVSRSPMEMIIINSVDDSMVGFRGGYISVTAVLNRTKAAGIRTPSVRTIQQCLENMGYVELGRCPRSYAQEEVNTRALLYGSSSDLDLEGYGKAQGYE